MRDGNKQISLATEDMFIWGQVHTDTPFYFPNREALLDLYADVVEHAGRRAARAEPRDDRAGGRRSGADRAAVGRAARQEPDPPAAAEHASRRSKALVPLIGLETGSVRMAKQIMPSKGVPFPIEDWPSVVVHGLDDAEPEQLVPGDDAHHRQPGRDRRGRAGDTLDLIYEVERRGLFAFFIPSIFTPLHDTRMETKKGVTETRELTPLQWQLMMKCWKMNLRPGQVSWWGPTAWRLGAIGLWAWKLRKLNGPNFTWPLLMFASALPGALMAKMGKIYLGRPLHDQDAARNCWRRSSRTSTSTCAPTPATCPIRRRRDTYRRRAQRSFISLVPPTPARLSRRRPGDYFAGGGCGVGVWF